jgi:hypothetical protein
MYYRSNNEIIENFGPSEIVGAQSGKQYLWVVIIIFIIILAAYFIYRVKRDQYKQEFGFHFY